MDKNIILKVIISVLLVVLVVITMRNGNSLESEIEQLKVDTTKQSAEISIIKTSLDDMALIDKSNEITIRNLTSGSSV